MVVTGGSSPGKVVLCVHEQSQNEALLCVPNHISRFLCPCLGFQQLNWASAANCLQPRGQCYCLFPWLSPRATQTRRRADTNTAFVALGMFLLPSQTISYQLPSDSSRGQHYSQPRERFPAAAAPLQFFLGKQRWERCVIFFTKSRIHYEIYTMRSMTRLIFPQSSLAFSFQRGLDRS